MQSLSMGELRWKLPLFDNLYLSMQGQNVMLIDVYLRDLEKALLEEYHRRERTPIPDVLFVSALSQMWVFATYELLRTWRQFIRDLKKTAAQPDEEFADDDRALRQMAEVYWRRHIERLRTDPAFGEQLDTANAETDGLFRRIESLRMNLAKHEVPKRKGELAMAPGYGRIDESNGSIYWFVDLGDQYVDVISRRAIGDELRHIVIGHPLNEESEEPSESQVDEDEA